MTLSSRYISGRQLPDQAVDLLDTAAAKEGDIVFVSAAGGAVGSAVVQIAKAKGMKVIGAAGGPDKCAWVKELGADACIDYKAGSVLKQLYEVAPEAVSKPQDPDEMMAVDYSKLVPMLIKEVQSLRARVAQLEGI